MDSSFCDHKSVGILVWKDGRLLLIDRKQEPFGLAAPAGHVDDHGEGVMSEEQQFEQAAREELQEETGLQATSLSLRIEGRKENPCSREGGTWHYWRIYEAQTKGELHPSEEETLGAYWVTPTELAELTRGGTFTTSRGEVSLESVWAEWLLELGY